MKKLIITVSIIFCHTHFSDIALTVVSHSKYSCQYIDSTGAETDKGFYLQISPESLNMIERNSKLREKIMDMLILLLSIHGAKAMYGINIFI